MKMQLSAAGFIFLWLMFLPGFYPVYGQKPSATPPNQNKTLIAAQKEYDEALDLIAENTLGSLQAALPKLKNAARLFGQGGDKSKQADAFFFTGKVLFGLGETVAAQSFYNQSLPVYRALKDAESESLVLNNLGIIFDSTGEKNKALDYFTQALKIARDRDDKAAQALILNNFGNLYDSVGEKAKALDYYSQSLPLTREAEDRGSESVLLNNIGKMLYDLGENQKALEFYNQSLLIAREMKDKNQEMIALNNIGVLYYSLGERIKSLDYYNQVLTAAQAVGDINQQSVTLNNIGMVYSAIGEKQKALDYLNKSLPLSRAAANKGQEAITLNNIGLIYFYLGKTTDALKFYNQALPIIRAVEDKAQEAKTLNNIGAAYDSAGAKEKAIEFYLQVLEINKITNDIKLTAIVLNNIGGIYLDLNQPEQALEILKQALPATRQVGDREAEAKMLNNFGKAYELSGEKQKAFDYYNQALTVIRTIGDKNQEAATLNNLMFLWDDLANQPFSIFFGKQSVNILQELRQNINGLDKETQQIYLKSVEHTYRTLAQILIKTGRIAEAEQILAMLKEEEVFDYLRRDKSAEDVLKQKVALSSKEQEALARYNALAGQITALGKEFGELDAERKKYDVDAAFPKQARYDELKKQLADASVVFQRFLDDLKVKFGQKDARVASVDSSLQKTLERLKANRAAIVSIIIGEKSLNIIVTTTRTQTAHTVEKSEKEINEIVADFRAALTNPEYDPRPAGQKLYDILIKPIEADLEGIEADTIVWSLDGTLRYVPPAALWDKDKGYLAERFANVVITLASRDTLALPVSGKADWQALGVGVSKQTEGFSALTAVPDELDCIITDAQTKTVSLSPQCPNGVMNGKKLLNEKFTLNAFENALGRFPIVHIASHFSLNPGNDKDSFLLLGGEQKRFTVENLRDVSLADVELIVLSACNTATPGGEKANGIEIEGFGAVAQKQGAKSVMASLWSVADSSTKDFMVKFYELYDKTDLSKAEAMRQAQVALLTGKYTLDVSAKKRRSDIADLDGNRKTQIPFKKDENAPFAHPYYWSPFILIGNWR